MIGTEFLTALADILPEYTNGTAAEDARAIRHANIVQDELEAEIEAINEDYFLVSATFPTVADQNRYSQPDDIAKTRYLEVVLDDTTDTTVRLLPLFGIDDKEFYQSTYHNHFFPGVISADATGQPTYYLLGGDFVELRAIPDAVYTIRFWYLKTLTAVADSSTTIELPDVLLQPLIYGTAIREKIYRGHNVAELQALFDQKLARGLSALTFRHQDGPFTTRYTDHPSDYV